MSTTPFANADSYKLSHWIQYPDNVVKVFSNFTPRKSRIPEQKKFILFGLQMFLTDLQSEFQQGFFDLPEKEAVEAFDAFYSRFFGESNEDSNARVRELHQLGYLPLLIKALPEGSAVKHGVPVFTVVNTHNRFPWLTNFIESYMSCEIWHSCTSATTAAYFRQTFSNYAEMSSDLDFMVDFQGHDFSMRGLPCIEAAAKSGMAHLLSFKGTDNLPSFEYADFYYLADAFSQREQLLGTSVPATEHSTMCAGGKDTEYETFQRLLTLYPTGIISVVSDTWDFWKVVTEMLPQLKEQIMSRDGKLVIRPDCYDEETQILTKTGWKFFKDLDADDLVAQVEDDQTYSFVAPTKIIAQKYVGDMIQIKDFHGKIDLLVTPNHKLHLRHKDGREIVTEAKEYKAGHWYTGFERSAKAQGPVTALTALERLLIAFQADGCIKKVNKETFYISFGFAKQRKLERLKAILDELEIAYCEDCYPSRKDQTVVTFSVDNTLPFGKAFEWVDLGTLNAGWANEFLDELQHWDGSIRNERRFKFDSAEREAVEVVERIAVAAGRGVLFSEATDDRKDCFSNIFTLHIMRSNLTGSQAIKTQVVPFDGTVYCVEVPSHRIIVKRNRGICVCGNSSPKTPVEMIIGDKDAEEGTPEYKGLIECLWDTFGGTVNSKGYKELDSHIGAIYGDSITKEYQEAILAGLVAKGFSSTNIVMGMGSFCVHPDTKILCSDLVWRTAGSLEVGQEIIAFDEDPTFADNRRAARQYRTATIEMNAPAVKNSSTIETDIGKPITASNDHPWLVFSKNRKPKNVFFNKTDKKSPRSAGLEWKTTEQLAVGDQIAYFGEPWEIEDTYEGGWLSGMFDGEGSYGKDTSSHRSIAAWKINISQNHGPLLEKLVKLIDKRKFTYYFNHGRKCPAIVLTGGWYSHLRFLGTVRPSRLLNKFKTAIQVGPALNQGRTYKLATVTKIAKIGDSPVASIRTSCGTFITEGYLSHNTYQYVTRDTHGLAFKATAVQVEHADGSFEWMPIFKDPLTDNSGKKSAKGLLAVVKDEEGEYMLLENVDEATYNNCELQPVFLNGDFMNRQNFFDIRKRVQEQAL